MNGIGRWLGAALLGAALVSLSWGAAPPQATGKLTAEQGRRLQKLDADLAKAADAGQMVDALRLAKEVERLRRRWQPTVFKPSTAL